MIWKLHKKYDAYVNEYNKYQQWLGPEKVTSLDNDSYRIEYEDMEKKRDWVNDEHKSMDWVMEMFSGDLDYLGRIYGEYRSKQGKKIDEMCKEEFLRKRDLLEKVNLRMQELIDWTKNNEFQHLEDKEARQSCLYLRQDKTNQLLNDFIFKETPALLDQLQRYMKGIWNEDTYDRIVKRLPMLVEAHGMSMSEDEKYSHWQKFINEEVPPDLKQSEIRAMNEWYLSECWDQLSTKRRWEITTEELGIPRPDVASPEWESFERKIQKILSDPERNRMNSIFVGNSDEISVKRVKSLYTACNMYSEHQRYMKCLGEITRKLSISMVYIDYQEWQEFKGKALDYAKNHSDYDLIYHILEEEGVFRKAGQRQTESEEYKATMKKIFAGWNWFKREREESRYF